MGDALKVKCDKCGARPGERCCVRYRSGFPAGLVKYYYGPNDFHAVRVAAAANAEREGKEER